MKAKIRANKLRKEAEQKVGDQCHSQSPDSTSLDTFNSSASSSTTTSNELAGPQESQTESSTLFPPLSPSLDQYFDQLLSQNESFIISDEIIDLLTTDSGEQVPNSQQAQASNQMVPYNSFKNNQSPYEAILEFMPYIQNCDTNQALVPLTSELGFPPRELILPEKYLLMELTNACTVLQNPYKRYEYFDLSNSGRMTEYTFYRLIRMCKQLSAFSQLCRVEQGLVLKRSLLRLLHMRSVLMYNRDRDSWCFVDVSHESKHKVLVTRISLLTL